MKFIYLKLDGDVTVAYAVEHIVSFNPSAFYDGKCIINTIDGKSAIVCNGFDEIIQRIQQA